MIRLMIMSFLLISFFKNSILSTVWFHYLIKLSFHETFSSAYSVDLNKTKDSGANIFTCQSLVLACVELLEFGEII